MELTGISLTETDGKVFLRYQPAAAAAAMDAPIDAPMLYALLEQSGFSGCWVLDEVITRAAHDCNTVQTPFVVQVAERRDATVQVHIAADDMSAQISLIPAQGGKPVTPQDVAQALAAAGVVFGIDEAALVHACALGQVELFTAASGLPAQNGRDAVFKSLLPQAADRAPKIDSNGLIDYREHGGIIVVHPGEPLMRRIPPTPGVVGHTVRGRELPARDGANDIFAPQLPGTQLASDDVNMLQAAVVGQAVQVKHGVMVEPVFRVQDVNMASGNIHFDGTVQVDGEVMQGMKVQASGDIIVRGTVDGGLLEAGGDIHIAAGIIAQARVQAQGAVSARFAENCSIFAGTVIALDDMALECELESLNQITIGAKVPQRGRLVGGSATAMMLLRVPLLGSQKGGMTRVKVGANPELESQLQELSLKLEKEKTTEENLQKLIKQLSTAGDPKGLLDRVKASWRQAVQVWSQSLAERGELEKQLALTQKARVEVGVGVAGAVDMAFGGKTVHLRTEFNNGVFSIDPEIGVVFTNPNGKVQGIA